MPLPEKHESLNDYVSRFMGDKSDRKKWPKQSQRAAVAYSEFKRKKRK